MDPLTAGDQDQPLRVAFLLTQDRGGPVVLTVALAVRLDKHADARVRIFGPRPSRGAAVAETLLQTVSIPSKLHLPAIRLAIRAVEDWHPDVVHAQDRRSGLVAAVMSTRNKLRRRTGPLILQTYHGVPDDVTRQWMFDPSEAGPSLYSRATLAADAVVARILRATVVPSPVMAEFLSGRLRVPSSRLHHIDNGLPLGPPSTSVPIKKLLFAGVLSRRKGVADLIEALAYVTAVPGFEDLEVTLVGDGPERVALQELVSARGLAERVQFLGFREDVPELLRSADAFVLPSRMEQQPLVLIEAMAAGKPILATDVGGVSDMLVGAEAASVIVPPCDPRALALGLQALRRIDTQAAGPIVSQIARRRFDVSVTADHHLRLYRRLLT